MREITERDARIAQLYRMGYKYQEIADEIGISLECTKSALDRMARHGVIRRRRRNGQSTSAGSHRKIRDLYASGMPICDVARKLGMNGSAVGCIVQTLVLNGLVERHDSEIDTGKMLALHRAGWSAERIADDLGLTAKQINRMIKERTK